MMTIGILGDSFYNTLESWKERRDVLKSLIGNYSRDEDVVIAILCDQIDFNNYNQLVRSIGHKAILMYNGFRPHNNLANPIDKAIVFSKGGIISTKYIEQLTKHGIQFQVIQLTKKIEEFKTKDFYVYSESKVVRNNVPENLQLGFQWHDISKKYWLLDEGELIIQSFITDRHNGIKLKQNGESYNIFLRSLSGTWYDFTEIAIGIIDSAWREAHIYKGLTVKSLFNALVYKLQAISVNPKAYKYAQYIILEEIDTM